MLKHSIAPKNLFFPQPTYVVGTYKEDGKPNFSLITYLTFCTIEPPILMFASTSKTLTRDLVKKNGMFSIHLVTSDMMLTADSFGMKSGFSVDKSKNINYTNGDKLNVPVWNDSPWVYECTLVDSKEIGDSIIYFGKIENILADENVEDTTNGKTDMHNVDPLIFAPGNYYKIGDKIGNVGDSSQK